ncbi:hypothetical protein RCL1_003450 [Eukaryota sp. TZLM3-RCL]
MTDRTRRKDILNTNEQYRALLEERQRLLSNNDKKHHLASLLSKKEKSSLQPSQSKPAFEVYFNVSNQPKAKQSSPERITTDSDLKPSHSGVSKWDTAPKVPLVIKSNSGDPITVSPTSSRSSLTSQQSCHDSFEIPPNFIERISNLSGDQFQQLLDFLDKLEDGSTFRLPNSPSSNPDVVDFSEEEQHDNQQSESDSEINQEEIKFFSEQVDQIPVEIPIPKRNKPPGFGASLAEAVRLASRESQRRPKETENKWNSEGITEVSSYSEDFDSDYEEEKEGEKDVKRPFWLEDLTSLRQSINFELSNTDKSPIKNGGQSNFDLIEEKGIISAPVPKNLNLDPNFLRQSVDMSLSRLPIKIPVISEPRSFSALSSLEVPRLPTCSVLKFQILSTFGDPNLVGLAGIEVFNSFGKLIDNIKVSAEPSCISPNDPRKPENLVDKFPRTTSLFHQWLAPFTGNNQIFLRLPETCSISMIRIWNYNASRIHCDRGSKSIKILSDDDVIFYGELKQAEGKIVGSKELAESIVFTDDEFVLDQLAKNDPVSDDESNLIDDVVDDVSLSSTAFVVFKGETSATVESPKVKQQSNLIVPQPVKTGVLTSDPSVDSILSSIKSDLYSQSTTLLSFYLTENYGDPFFIGLTSIFILILVNNSVQILNPSVIVPSVISSSDSNISQVIHPRSKTINSKYMFLSRKITNEPVKISFKFSKLIEPVGLLIYGYNKPLETSRSCKRIFVTNDQSIMIGPGDGFLLRKPPGDLSYDFGQILWFKKSEINHNFDPSITCLSKKSPSNARFIKPISQLYLTPHLPRGLILQLVIRSTHGDVHYVGLNGMEIITSNGIINSNQVQIYSNTVSFLDSSDPRKSIENLLNPPFDDVTGESSWLIPFKVENNFNRIYFVFSSVVELNVVRIYNYSKDLMRGVAEFDLYLDDYIVFQGSCPPKESISIVFDHTSPQILFRERQFIYNPAQIQPVVFINDEKVVENPSIPSIATESKNDRPYTMLKKKKR